MALDVTELRRIGKKITQLNKKYHNKIFFSPLQEFIVFSTSPSKLDKLVKCGNSRSLIYIGSNGLVYPCIGTAFPEFVIGDIKEETLAHIWKTSNLIKKLRFRLWYRQTDSLAFFLR